MQLIPPKEHPSEEVIQMDLILYKIEAESGESSNPKIDLAPSDTEFEIAIDVEDLSVVVTA